MTRLDSQRGVCYRSNAITQYVCTCVLHHQHKTELNVWWTLACCVCASQSISCVFRLFWLTTRAPDDLKVSENTFCWMDLLHKNAFQSPLTVVCGEYCVVFLLYFLRFKGLRRFLGLFNCDLLENARRILEFVKKSYHLNLPLFISELWLHFRLCTHQ